MQPSELKESYTLGIILGGYSNSNDSTPEKLVLGSDPNRLSEGLRLYKTGRIKKFVLTGGTGAFFDDGVSEAPLAKKFLSSPKRIEVSRAASTNKDITAFKVMTKSRAKQDTLRWLLSHDLVETAIIFANRKTTVRELNKSLQRDGFRSGEIHGDMDQSSRLQELARFKAGEVNILVASDVAARGLDIKGVGHVFNYDTPWHPDDYVHRIGRTGRAGAKGRAFTFVTPEDAEAIENVEKLTGSEVPVFGQKDVRVELRDPSQDKAEKADEPGKEKPARKSRRKSEERDENAQESSPKDKPRRGRSRSERDDERDDVPTDEGRGASKDRSRNDRPRNDRRNERQDDPVPAGEWNGPRPTFLDVSALA